MGSTIEVNREGILVFQFSVSDDVVGPISGASPTVELMDGISGQFLDFGDFAFKNAGWISKSANLISLVPGFYWYAIPMVTISGLPVTSETLIAQYRVTVDGVERIDHDVVRINRTEAPVADLRSLAYHRLVVNLSTQKLELYDAAGTTIVQQWPLLTAGGEPVGTQFGVQTVRGVPEL